MPNPTDTPRGPLDLGYLREAASMLDVWGHHNPAEQIRLACHEIERLREALVQACAKLHFAAAWVPVRERHVADELHSAALEYAALLPPPPAREQG